MSQDAAARAAELDFLIRHSHDAILLIDRAGALARLNPAAALLGLSADAQGQPLDAALANLPALRDLLASAEASEATIALPDERRVQVTIQPLPDGARIALLHDVTERESIDTARRKLVRQVAHDLRNPLNALSGFVDLAMTAAPITDEQREYLERVQRIAEKLYTLADQLVELAWIDAGMPLDPRPHALNAIVKAAVEAQARLAEQRTATIALDLAADDLTVTADARQMQQAIGAVLRNALLYAPSGSTVTVRTCAEAGAALCAVVDRGFGAGPSDAEKVFDRLWRSQDPRIQTVPGGGIGLTLARAIVARHGGAIAFDSQPDEGTTVTFTLPLAEAR